MKKKKHKISKVLPGSIGEELELEPGDVLAEINHQAVEDVFDYRECCAYEKRAGIVAEKDFSL